MSYTALYRKFRPERFEEVKGQEHIVTTLKNQIRTGRTGHAYLFCGTRGTGKTTVAKILAKAVNCEAPEDGSPCGRCASCRAIASGAAMNVIEIDAASNNGVDNVREIVDEVSYSPAEGRYKVYIIDEVHMLSIGAFNALLKTLEEPPSYVIFILATTEVHKIPVTILSRCQRYDFRRIGVDTITDRLRELMDREGNQAEERALRYIAKMADGSMRDALSLLDQCLAFHYGKALTYEDTLDVLGAVDTGVFSRMFRYILSGDASSCIVLLEEIVMQGRDLSQFVADFTWYLRNLLLLATSPDAATEDVIDVSAENLKLLREEAGMTEPEGLMRYIRELSELSGNLRYAGQKRIQTEITLIRMCRPEMKTDLSSLLERIRVLEQRVEQGALTALPAQTGAPGTLETDPPGAWEEKKQKKRAAMREIAKALPEDARRAAQRWQAIITRTAMPMKQYLKDARLSLDGEGRLVVCLREGLASDYFFRQENGREAVKRLLAEELGKEVDVVFEAYAQEDGFAEDRIDLEQVIHMEIEEE